MRISSVFSRNTPLRAWTALRLARWWGPAARLLRGGPAAEEEPSRSATPYDSLLVHRIRSAVRPIARIPLIGRRLALRSVGSAFLELERKGWHCSLHAGGGDPVPRAQLRLWGARVLDLGDQEAELRCVGRAGGSLEGVPARWPGGGDSSVARADSTGDLSDDLAGLLDQLGGLSGIIAPGARVLLKPNFNSYHAPPASTRLELLTALVHQLRDAGASEVALGECSAIALGRTREVLRRAGLPEWAEAHEVRLRYFDEEPWSRCEIPGRHFREIIVPACLPEFDHIIYLLSAKTHRQAGVSLGLKMTIGLMHPAQRIELHGDHLTERIADASLAVRPDLAILDATQCFISGGPALGTVASPGVMLASRDLEALEERGLELLAEHGAIGLEAGREQLETVLALRTAEEGGITG